MLRSYGTGGTYRVLVTGSRGWDRPDLVREKLAQAADTARVSGIARLVVVHGACRDSPDVTAADWVNEVRSAQRFPGLLVEAEPHPADWATYPSGAGFVRNAEMVHAGADMCLSFTAACSRPSRSCPRGPHGSHGAADCTALAEQAGILTVHCGPF